MQCWSVCYKIDIGRKQFMYSAGSTQSFANAKYMEKQVGYMKTDSDLNFYINN